MKKTLIAGAIVVVLSIAAYFGAGVLAKSGAGTTPETAASTTTSGTGQSADPNQPDRTAEVKGTVVSVDGTTLMIDRVIGDPSAELTDEEKAARKAERQGMTMEERQAAKAADQAGLDTERVTVEVPVGVAITRMVNDGEAPTARSSTLADIKSGLTVSVWTDGAINGGVAEYVKIQGMN